MILLPETVDLSIDQVIANDAMIVTSRSREFTAACPSCGQAAKRVHSRYRRKLSDLAVSGRPVRLVLETRGFFCDNAWCPRKTFAEQTPNLVRPHAQRMVRLQVTLQQLGLALDGEGEPSLASGWDSKPARIVYCVSYGTTSTPARNQPRSLGLMSQPTSVACATER